ncbi:sugar transferase [Ktedonosporobacter rubrisoli]|uniref:Sugar transferase n=1 Tax=Ktedonosporobacter rubrisoli TaxID=2509675 RepID=A0A4P6K0R9_KTERU|nr:sugar transferase [Ktedonosporobacter rubrisoli]QBD81737.1 sugar transferase [Ktedonosporobacter rubrisoli]
MEQTTVIPARPEDNAASQANLNISRELVSTEIIYEPSVLYHASKRFLDFTLSLIGLILLVPVFLIIAICIKLDDGGEVLHFREIIGLHGRRFFALKFRTMITNADDYLAKHPELRRKYLQNMKLDRDPRITRVGRFLRKTSLDELPQLFNVLLGQMSLVGPRMIHPSELPRYGEWANKRLAVKPGITGLWQISGRQHISYSERVLLDMRYIDHRSLFIDLAILVKTFKVFVIHTGA